MISNLRMIKLTSRGKQSDGINYTGIGTGAGSIISDNNAPDVDEGLAIFDRHIELADNRFVASRMPSKLICAAKNILIHDNEFVADLGSGAVTIFRANPLEPQRQAKNIFIEKMDSRFYISSLGDLRYPEGEYPPTAITIWQTR